MTKTFTTAEVAKRLKVAPSTITRRAAELSLGKVQGRGLVFTAGDIKRLDATVRHRAGNPEMDTPKRARELGRKGGKS